MINGVLIQKNLLKEGFFIIIKAFLGACLFTLCYMIWNLKFFLNFEFKIGFNNYSLTNLWNVYLFTFHKLLDYFSNQEKLSNNFFNKKQVSSTFSHKEKVSSTLQNSTNILKGHRFRLLKSFMWAVYYLPIGFICNLCIFWDFRNCRRNFSFVHIKGFFLNIYRTCFLYYVLKEQCHLDIEKAVWYKWIDKVLDNYIFHQNQQPFPKEYGDFDETDDEKKD